MKNTPHVGNEEWRDILGWEQAYQVSDKGNIRSKERTVLRSSSSTRPAYKAKLKPQLIRQWISNCGYALVCLRFAQRERRYSVHILVLEAFVGPRPTKRHVACHCDGVKTNNAASNLRWDTRMGNEADKLMHGTSVRGQRNGQNKLSEDDVLAIRASANTGRDLARRFRVHRKTISDIRSRRIWSWL